MVEIRNRLVLGDGDLLGYGFQAPRFEVDLGRLFNIADVDCPACEARAGERCGKTLWRQLAWKRIEVRRS